MEQDSELAYFSSLLEAREDHQDKMLVLGEAARRLQQSPDYQLFSAAIRAVSNAKPPLPADANAPFRAFGFYKFSQGIEYFFAYVDRVVTESRRIHVERADLAKQRDENPFDFRDGA